MKKLNIEKITNNRLWKLMNDNDITDSKDFARLLIDKSFYTFQNLGDKSADSTSNEYKQYYKNVDTLSKAITRCLYDNQFQNDNLLIACRRFFDCSADYLLGLIELPTYADTDIYNETGLEKDAINTLSVLKEFNKDCDQYRKPVELEALNFIMKDSEKFREFIGYISALFIGADKAFYRDKEDKKWRFISDLIHITYPTSKNSNRKQTANTGLLNIKSLAETDCIRHIELLLENWKQEFKKKVK